VLAVHPGALGDVLLSVPALRALRRRHPTERLSLAAQPRIGDLLVALGVVDAAVPLDALGLHALFAEDRPFESASALTRWSRCVCWFGSRDPGFARRLRALIPDAVVAPSVSETRPVWEHLLATIDEPARDQDEPLKIPSALAATGLGAVTGLGWDETRGPVFVHPGAGGRAKCWSTEGYAAVVESLRGGGWTVILHRGPATPDTEAIDGLLPRLDVAPAVLGEPPLPTLAGALAHASAWIGNDSGVTHLAAALGVPSLVVCTPEMTRWVPWSRTARVVVVTTDRLHRADLGNVLRGVDRMLGEGRFGRGR
jgi:ADP-heptose:LPS heptosyltransferase